MLPLLRHFQKRNEQDREFLQLFSFICTLSFDVYVKKQIIEKLIDSLPEKFPNYYEKKKVEASHFYFFYCIIL